MVRDALRQRWQLLRHKWFVWSTGLADADKINTHLTREEKRVLFDLVQRIRPRVTVEIGSYLGCSSSFMAAAMRNSTESTLYCVDTWQNDAMSEGQRDTFEEFQTNTTSFREHIQPVRQRSTTAARCFDQPIDLLFIDGDHTYEAVHSDWLAWSRHLRNGATVIMHDVGWAEGVQRVVQEEIHPRALAEHRMPNLYWATVDSQALDS